MKSCFFAITILVSGLSSVAYGQQAKLEGHVFDAKGARVSALKISAPGGQATETESRGHFKIVFHESIKPGQATRIEIERTGWVIYEPLLSNCITQNSEGNFQPLKVIIVPKGSPLAYSPKRLAQVIARWANERAKLTRQLDKLSGQLDEFAFLKEYSEKYGITLDQFVNAAQQWAQSKESNDKEEQALKEYFLKNYERAAKLAHESALIDVEELNQENKRKTETSLKVIRKFKLEGNSFYAVYKFKEALAAYNEIENLFSTRELSQKDLIREWAEMKILLGNTKMELGTRVEGRESQTLLSETLKEYQQAFTVYTREQSPQNWAATQNNLGIVLRVQGERLGGVEGERALVQAVEACREALKVNTREQLPQDWAMTQINLGGALIRQGERLGGAEGERVLVQAVEAFQEALKVFTREQLPQQWAMTQINLGGALSMQGERLGGAEGERALVQAVEAFQEALKVFTREQLPQQWALTQNNLGFVLRIQGERLEGEKVLVQAMEACREALKVYTREQLPQQWAMAQINLAGVLLRQGERLGGAEGGRVLAQSAGIYREVLKVYTREQLPQQWAGTQNSLGGVLGMWGEKLGGAEGDRLLVQAMEACREALKVYTREQLPQQWAGTQHNLGTALGIRGERLGGAEGDRLLVQAVEVFREALKVYTREQLPQQWAMTQIKLGNVLGIQGEKLEGAEGDRLLAQSAGIYKEVLKVYTREQLPQQWALTQHNLGYVLGMWGEKRGGAEGHRLLVQSVEAFREALKIRTREQLPQQWAMTQNYLARNYYLLQNWTDAIESCANILTLYPDHEEAYLRMSAIYHDKLFKFEEAFTTNQQWLVRHPNDIPSQADLAEKYFTTGSYAECENRINALLVKPEVPIDVRIALRAIEIADLIALKQNNQVIAKIEAIIAEVSTQPIEFKVNWVFDGTRHFIAQNEKLSSYRTWLAQLFDALAGPNRDQIVKALKEAKANFK